MPTIINRPSGLALIIWPNGETNVVSHAEAEKLMAQMAMAESAAVCRGCAL